MTTMADGFDEPRTLADSALRKLRWAIISGELEPGSPLRLRELIGRLQMSSVPIREALRYLEHSGLVDRRPHRGALVAEISIQDLRETYAIRVELETMAVRMAAESMTPEQASDLADLMDEYARAFEAEAPNARELHRRLHMALYGVSGSKWLLRVIPMLWDNSQRYQRLSLLARGPAEETIAEHRSVVEACIQGDADAAEGALRAHLSQTIEAAIAALEQHERVTDGQRPEDPRPLPG